MLVAKKKKCLYTLSQFHRLKNTKLVFPPQTQQFNIIVLGASLCASHTIYSLVYMYLCAHFYVCVHGYGILQDLLLCLHLMVCLSAKPLNSHVALTTPYIWTSLMSFPFFPIKWNQVNVYLYMPFNIITFPCSVILKYELATFVILWCIGQPGYNGDGMLYSSVGEVFQYPIYQSSCLLLSVI